MPLSSRFPRPCPRLLPDQFLPLQISLACPGVSQECYPAARTPVCLASVSQRVLRVTPVECVSAVCSLDCCGGSTVQIQLCRFRCSATVDNASVQVPELDFLWASACIPLEYVPRSETGEGTHVSAHGGSALVGVPGECRMYLVLSDHPGQKPSAASGTKTSLIGFLLPR